MVSVVQHPETLRSALQVGASVLAPLGNGLSERHGRRDTALLQRATRSLPALADVRQRISADEWAEMHAELCACARARFLQQGELLAASALAGSFFIILRGWAAVLQAPPRHSARGRSSAPEPQTLGALGPGACVADLTQMWLSPFAAGLKALKPLELLELPNSLRASVLFKRQVLALLYERATCTHGLPLLQGHALPKPLLLGASTVRARAGETIVRQGEPCEGLCLLLQGRVSVEVALVRPPLSTADLSSERQPAQSPHAAAAAAPAADTTPSEAASVPTETLELARVGPGELLSEVDVLGPLLSQARAEAGGEARGSAGAPPAAVHSASARALVACTLLFLPTELLLRNAGQPLLAELFRQADANQKDTAALLERAERESREGLYMRHMRDKLERKLYDLEKPKPSAPGPPRAAAGAAAASARAAADANADAADRPSAAELQAEKLRRVAREERLRLPHLLVGPRSPLLRADGHCRPVPSPAAAGGAGEGGEGGGLELAAQPSAGKLRPAGGLPPFTWNPRAWQGAGEVREALRAVAAKRQLAASVAPPRVAAVPAPAEPPAPSLDSDMFGARRRMQAEKEEAERLAPPPVDPAAELALRFILAPQAEPGAGEEAPARAALSAFLAAICRSELSGSHEGETGRARARQQRGPMLGKGLCARRAAGSSRARS